MVHLQMHMYAHLYVQIQMNSHVHVHVHVHMYEKIWTCKNVRVHVHINICVCNRSNVHAQMYEWENIHVYIKSKYANDNVKIKSECAIMEIRIYMENCAFENVKVCNRSRHVRSLFEGLTILDQQRIVDFGVFFEDMIQQLLWRYSIIAIDSFVEFHVESFYKRI